MSNLIAVIGDTHSQIGLAGEGIERIEEELGRCVDQVFSVGDLGLFLNPEDWEFLTGPKKYRHPEESAKIRAAWQKWRWPLSAIAGNHEPFNRLRDWDPEYFGGKLNYTDAGELINSIPGLRVVGLSGIFHPEELSFVSPIEAKNRKLPRAETWPDAVHLAAVNKISRNRLAYYKQWEVDALKESEPFPHLLLLHDWPVDPPHVNERRERPEAEIVSILSPDFACYGHHHTAHEFTLGLTRGFALNIISSGDLIYRHHINPGWCVLFEYEEGKISFLNTWPQTS